jgi:hypothetical protein
MKNRSKRILSGGLRRFDGGQLLKPNGHIVKEKPVVVAQCTPSLGTVSLWWSRFIQSIHRENCSGWNAFYLRDRNGGEIAEVRNNIVSNVLDYNNVPGQKHPISHLFWVDDDVFVMPSCFLELYYQDKDIISGVYFTKREGDLSRPLIYPTECGGSDRFRPDQVYPVWGHGMGLTLIRTEVYQRMLKELDLGMDRHEHPQWYRTTTKDAPTVTEDGTIATGDTEDIHFLKNAALLGYQPWIDCRKHAFGFHYQPAERLTVVRCKSCNTSQPLRMTADALTDIACVKCGKTEFAAFTKIVEEDGYPQKQWAAWIKGDKISWETQEGVIEWD